MSLRYCSLHGRLFSFTQQCWLTFPADKIHAIKSYAALLRTTHTEAFSLTVFETSCDTCVATFWQVVQSSRYTEGLRSGEEE